MSIDVDRLQSLLRLKEWASAHAMLDDARDTAATAEDRRREVYWRGVALEKQQRYDDAVDLLRRNSQVFSSQSHVRHEIACLLLRQGRDQEALDELGKAPFETEMASFYGLAIDAKFFYLYLLASGGDTSVKERLSEIPDDYRHITMDGTILMKSDIVAALDRR